jgi:hypothetical protein
VVRATDPHGRDGFGKLEKKFTTSGLKAANFVRGPLGKTTRTWKDTIEIILEKYVGAVGIEFI